MKRGQYWDRSLQFLFTNLVLGLFISLPLVLGVALIAVGSRHNDMERVFKGAVLLCVFAVVNRLVKRVEW